MYMRHTTAKKGCMRLTACVHAQVHTVQAPVLQPAAIPAVLALPPAPPIAVRRAALAHLALKVAQTTSNLDLFELLPLPARQFGREHRSSSHHPQRTVGAPANSWQLRTVWLHASLNNERREAQCDGYMVVSAGERAFEPKCKFALPGTMCAMPTEYLVDREREQLEVDRRNQPFCGWFLEANLGPRCRISSFFPNRLPSASQCREKCSEEIWFVNNFGPL